MPPLMIRCKYLVIIGATFPQLEVIEINNLTNNRRNCVDMNKGRMFQVGANVIKIRTKFFNSSMGGENKTGVGVNIVTNP